MLSPLLSFLAKMKVSLDALKKAKKRTATEGGAPKTKKAITKKPQVALGGPSASSRAPALYPPKALTTMDDDDMEIVLALIFVVPVSFATLAPSTAGLRDLRPSIPEEAKRKGKAR